MPESSGSGGEPHQGVQPPEIMKSGETASTITLPDVFQLGIHFEYLRNVVSDSEEPEANKRDIIKVLEMINTTLSNQDTQGEVSELVSRQQRILGEPSDPEEQISQEEAEELKKNVISWIHLFARDLGNETRIPVITSGVLDMEVLTDQPNDLFDQDVWGWLDERPKQDIIEACRSVAVGCATASVMLSLRAVEHCLREWYEQDNESLDAAWGRVLDGLMEEYAQEDKRNDTVLTQLSDLPPVLTSLYYLKEKRNEVNHPEESPSPREARRTLLIVASTISEIYEVMKDEAADEAVNELDERQATFDPVTKRRSDDSMSDAEAELLQLIHHLDKHYEDGIPRQAVVDSVDDIGISVDKLDDALQELMMDGRVYEPGPNTLKPI